MVDPAGEWLLIADGVHRSVAAREAGLPGILAQVERDGVRLGLRVVGLEQLVSPKSSIGRWDRNRDFLALVALMGTAAGRTRLPVIFVEPVSEDRASQFTRLLDVAILEEPEEDAP